MALEVSVVTVKHKPRLRKTMFKNYFSGWQYLVVLLYPPLVFTYKIPDSLRIALFVFLTTFLFAKIKKLQPRQIVNFFILALLVCVQLSLSDQMSDKDMRNAGSLFLTLSFAVSLNCAANNKKIANDLLTFYINLFSLIPILILLAYAFFFAFGELNLFNLKIGAEGAVAFRYTPFGILFEKTVIYRSVGFFHEPQLLAFFFAANMFMPLINSDKNNKIFPILNFIGGILTFSFLFFITVLFVYLLKLLLTKKISNIGIAIVLVIAIIFAIVELRVFDMSSLSERVERAAIYFYLYPSLSTIQVWLGTGFNVDTGYDFAINSGPLSLLYTVGVVGLLSIVILMWTLTYKNYYLFIVCFMAFLSFEPFYYPLFWLAITAYSVASRRNLPSSPIKICNPPVN